MDDLVRWNRRVVSAKSLIIAIEGTPYQGITSLDYSDKMDPGIVYGAQRDGAPIGMTSGKYTPAACSLTFLADVYRLKFQTQLAAMALLQLQGSGIGMAEWTLSVQHVEPGAIPTTDFMSGCRMTELKDKYQEGSEALMTEVSFQPLIIMRNGLALFDLTRGLI